MQVRDLVLPNALRSELAQPWGPVVDTATLQAMLRRDDVLACVGDIVSITALELGLEPRLIVCDYRTQRGEDPDLRRRLADVGQEVRVENPAGTVAAAAWQAVKEGLQGPATTRIVVDGEEDLLGIPCFLEAPDGAVVLYGMPGQGVVVCPVTTQLRAKVEALAQRMLPPSDA